jgi:hypothetical protein
MVDAATLPDLEWCHAPSTFHSLRLEAIIDRYLSRGAETPVGAGRASLHTLISNPHPLHQH